MDGLDQAYFIFEDFVKAMGQRLIESAVELDGGESGFAGDGGDLVGVVGVEDAYALDVLRQVRGDAGDLGGGDLTLARGEDEAEGVGA